MDSKEIVEGENIVSAVGPYSQAIKAGGFLFCSGQIAIDHKTNTLVEDEIKAQTQKIFENLKNILEAAGVTFDAIVKTTVYLKDINDFPQMNEIYASYFQKPYPARSTVEISCLPKGARIEIEVIAKL